MTTPEPDRDDSKTPKRFTTPEEFRREYYPKSTEQDEINTQLEGGFGQELALDSLDRHARTLQLCGG